VVQIGPCASFRLVYLYGFMYSLSNVQCVFTSILSINGMVETSMFVHVLLCTFLKEKYMLEIKRFNVFVERIGFGGIVFSFILCA